MNEQQINKRLKLGWSWSENWRGEQDDGFVADGFITIRGKRQSAAIRGCEMFATLFYFTPKGVLKRVTI